VSAAKTALYGSWESPIDAGLIAEAMIGLGEVMVDGDDVYWLEVRPSEKGRCVVVRRSPAGSTGEAIPAGCSARTRVHEYGGGAYLPLGDRVAFVNFADQFLYLWGGEGDAVLLAGKEGVRYADFVHDAGRDRLIAVQEDHRGGGVAANRLAAVALDSSGATVLQQGRDFYAAPRLSPNGRHLAWLAWDLPDMPWDAAELWLADVEDDGRLAGARRIAGGEGESVVQPLWSPGGVLHFISDHTNWWNLYRFRYGVVDQLTDLEAEFSPPLWVFRTSSYAFAGPDRIVCAYHQDGIAHLAVLEDGRLRTVECPFTSIGSMAAGERYACFVGGSPSDTPAVVRWDLEGGGFEVLKRAGDLGIDPVYFSPPEPVEFPTGGGEVAHGLFYEPHNPDFVGPRGELPPLIVRVHGGPTAATSAELRLGIQYYTSRGFAVLDVNYRGSTGYGRAYRELLYGQWGVADVDDCCSGARWLAEQGRVDGRRMAISGGSAGGYTVLCCLAFRDVFAAGASHFGVSDCETLATDTHKFESRYLDKLIGPYPERADLYRARSPIHHVDGLSCPVIFFQGLEDRIVPPSQAEALADALRAKGIPVAYVPFEGEQHGFRQSANIRRALEAELYFLARVFAFAPADEIAPVPIDNL
jgi:dipeptidyl aminopeptidase/acylaminoacyl peptidase